MHWHLTTSMRILFYIVCYYMSIFNFFKKGWSEWEASSQSANHWEKNAISAIPWDLTNILAQGDQPVVISIKAHEILQLDWHLSHRDGTQSMQLHIANAKYPDIVYNHQDQCLLITKESTPEHAKEFWDIIIKHIKKNLKPHNLQTMQISLRYFNTASSKSLLDIFRATEFLWFSGERQVTVLRCHEEDDEDMQEAGEDYASIIPKCIQRKNTVREIPSR